MSLFVTPENGAATSRHLPLGSIHLSRPAKIPREVVLRGLVGRGHGQETVSAVLGTDRETVLEWVVALDLPTPHARPMRRNTSAKAWSTRDYARLIEGWEAGWHAASIAEQLNRSPGSVRSKFRWIGFPSRDRRSLVRVPGEALSPPQSTQAVPENSRDQCVSTADGIQITVPKCPMRGHVLWTAELDTELANRYWANQHYAAVAGEWGMSARTIASRACRLELPRRERSKLVAFYDPSIVAANIAEARYVHRRCLAIPSWSFWSPKNGPRISKRARRLQMRGGSGYGLVVGSSVGASYEFGM